MKKIIGLICFASLLLSGCTVNELENPQNRGGDFPIFYASFGDAADETTKTYVDEKMTLRWTEDDRLSIFVGNTFNREYKYDGETGANNGSFSAIGSPEFVSAEPLDANYAVYPYNDSNEMSTDGSMSVVLQSIQKYAQNSFGLGANTMVAATENKEDNFLQFKNLCGYVVVKLYGDGIVTSIKLEGNDGEKISGKADVQVAYGILPSVTMSEEATTSITLDCGEGVTLGTSPETATEFWFCVPPLTFSKGFTITATKTDGWQMIKSTSLSKEVVRNTKNALTPIAAVFDKEPDNSQELALEREALIALYNALDGDNWSSNDNWCSDKPLWQWHGVYTNERGFVIGIYPNLLSPVIGYIPKEIGNLSHLSFLGITLQATNVFPEEIGKLKELENVIIQSINNDDRRDFPEGLYECSNLKELTLSGDFNVQLSSKIGQLKQLQVLDLCPDDFSGSLPDEIGELTNLEKLIVQVPNNNCCIGEIPASIGNLHKLNYLWLRNFSGRIPSELGNLQNLETLWFYSNFPVESIPEEIYTLRKLISLTLSFSMLPYCIPEAIGNLTELENLQIDYCLYGRIPEALGNLTKLKILDMQNPFPSDNGEFLIGGIPQSLQNLEYFPYFWLRIVSGHPYLGVSNFYPAAPIIKAKDLSGNVIDTEKSYSENRLTIISMIDDYCPYGVETYEILKKVYAKYADKGLEIISYMPTSDEQLMNNEVNRLQIPWKMYSSDIYPFPNGGWGLGGGAGAAIVVDSSGRVAYNNMTGTNQGMEAFIDQVFSSDNPEYVSTDFSKDGQVITLQKQSFDTRNNLILIGDGFSDRQIESGIYQESLNKAAEAFFSEEPYKSLRDMFNVYSVIAVSKAEGYDNAALSAVGGWFGEETEVGGIDGNAIAYALNAVDENVMDDAVIIVVMNKDAYAGTCYMYYRNTGDYGRGLSIAYFPASSDTDTFNGLVSHEAGGHGFAKLGDEYAYEYNGTISDWDIYDIRQMEQYGWYKNVDFTSDPTQVKWSKFLSDERYANEGLGCFEGGLTYWNGVWRPTDYSIMRYNTGGFNAPSREAIWYRIHKLAYGEEWQYNYEDFVTYDAINRTPAAQAASRAKVARATAARKGKPFQPLHEPVVIKRSWRDAVNDSGNNNSQ